MSGSRGFDTDAIILDLSKIERILSSGTPAEKVRFLSNIDQWATQRRCTLSELKKLKTELNDICLNAKIGKCVGNGVGIVGGLATLIGLGLQLSNETRSCGKLLVELGIGAGALGGVTSATSSGVEYMVNRKLFNDVNSAIEKDQQMTIQLMLYLKKSEDLNALFKQVFDCDVFSDKVKDFFTVVREITTLVRQGKYAYEEISAAFCSSVDEGSYSFELEYIKRVFHRLSKQAQFLMREFFENPSVRKALLKIEQAITSSPAILAITKVSARVFFRMCGISKEPEYQSLIFQFGSVAKASDIMLRTVTLAQDIVAFIEAVKNVTDSESKYSGMVEDIEVFLLKELNQANYLVNQFRRGAVTSATSSGVE